MADETTPQGPSGQPNTEPVPHRYEWLRWAIRITGIVLMLGGTLYLGAMAAQLLTDTKSDTLYMVIGSIVALGVGIVILRIGYSMLRAINPQTIGSFSFIFALVYTIVLIQVLPISEVLGRHPLISCLLICLCFGLSYWILRTILLQLLLPRNER